MVDMQTERMTRETKKDGKLITRRFAFLLQPQFSMIAFASALEPLRIANRILGDTVYTWKVFGVDDQPAVASSGIEISTSGAFDIVDEGSIIIVIGGLHADKIDLPKKIISRLRYYDSHGSMIGGVCTAALLMARSGLLNGYRSTVHWENLKSFREVFPDIESTSMLYEIDRNRFTCAGGTAALDFMLHFIGEDYGSRVSNAVADQVMHHRIRYGDEPQRLSLRARYGISHPKLLQVIEIMERNLEVPLSCNRMARAAGLSTRQLERLFNRYLGSKPSRFYLQLRLDQARLVLQQTSQPIINVALLCGFVSASHFSKCYRERFMRTPSEERRRYT